LFNFTKNITMKTLRNLILFCAGMLLLASLFSCNKKAPTYSYTCTVYLVSYTTGDTSVYFSQPFIDVTKSAQQTEAELLAANPNGTHNFAKCQ
jgi:hypothetical protein